MSDGAAIADPPVIDAPAETARPAPRRRSQPEPQRREPPMQPPYAVVLENDDEHTFDYVIELLMKVFRLKLPRALRLTHQIHTQGEAVVWTGTLELAELKRDQVRGYGPDFYASKAVTFPLGVRLEPMRD
jgi:ATP-dependent Clp protease adaptor protein ClpS